MSQPENRGRLLKQLLTFRWILRMLIVKVQPILSIEVGVERDIVVPCNCQTKLYAEPTWSIPATTILASKSASSNHLTDFRSSDIDPWFVISPACIRTSPFGRLNAPYGEALWVSDTQTKRVLRICGCCSVIVTDTAEERLQRRWRSRRKRRRRG